MAVLVLVPALLLWVPVPAAQMAARAVAWLWACVATVACLVDSVPHMQVVGVAFPSLLLLLGRSGLKAQQEPSAFQPRAFRLTLSVSITLALADAALFLIPVGPMLAEGRFPHTAIALALLLNGGVLLTGAVLMYHLRIAGVVLSLLGNAGMLVWLVVAQMVGTRMHESPPGLLWLLVGANVGVQVLLQVPLLLALTRGAGHAAFTDRVAGAVLPLLLLAMATVCAVSTWRPWPPTLRALGLL